MIMASSQSLDILACPVCKGKLAQQDDSSSLLCKQCNLTFPIRDGIPVMLVDEAQRIS
jgi:uncharacterized protein YbaR (Trm112 family)